MASIIVGVIALLLDQLLKLWTVSNLDLNTGIKNIPGLLQLTHIKNFGAVFGVLKNAAWLRWLALLLLIAFTVIMILGLKKKIIRSSFSRWTGTLLLAGLLGNGIDRAIYGYVVDMLEFKFGSFPIFNIADVLILVFGVLFCISIFAGGLDFSGKKEEPEYEYKPAAPARTRPAAEPSPVRTRRPAEESTPVRTRPAAEASARSRRPAEESTPVRTRPAAPAAQSRPRSSEEEYLAARRARTAAAASNRIAEEEDISPTRVRRPITEDEIQPIRVSRPVAPAAAAPVKPAAAAPARPAAPVAGTAASRPTASAPAVKPAASAPAKSSEDDFDLESILAEFK